MLNSRREVILQNMAVIITFFLHFLEFLTNLKKRDYIYIYV